MNLPIQAVLPDLLAALRERPSAVLVAPPGAGKTTMVAPALLPEPWVAGGQIWLLSPRRLAARAAAERMADLAGEKVGEMIGYATRLESRSSARTRILVVTEGIFRRRIQADPELAGVAAVLFDEVHERSLEGDFGLALALDAQAGLREDLRLLAMSATLDGARFAALMDGAPVIESQGRSYPIDLRHIGRPADARIEDAMAAAIRRALSEESEGDLLAFLPGVGVIERTAERLTGLALHIALHKLHGSLDPAEQRAALRPAPPGTRKIILATSIAETSLTIDGVRIVIDSGLARRPRHDLAAGLTRLVTERASQAAVTQRAGRAGRQAPGVAYRLWEAAATAGLPPFDPPEILESDLTGLTLDCAVWGVTDPASLRWLDPPPAASISEARRRLIAIDALDGEGRATAHGRAVAELPLEPRLAHMLLVSATEGEAAAAADVAVLLTERGLGGPSVDLVRRHANWARERGPRAEGARGLARRWLALVKGTGRSGPIDDALLARCLIRAFPDRIAKRRDSTGADWISVGGRGFRLDPADPLARAAWLAVGEIQGSAVGARILSAVAMEEGEVLATAAARITDKRIVRWRKDLAGVEALRERWLGAIRLSSGPDEAPERAAVIATLARALRSEGLGHLPWGKAAESLRTRADFAGVGAPISDAALLDDAEAWLDLLLPASARRLTGIDPGALHGLLTQRLGWDATRQIEALAPAEFRSPAGSHHAIDYAAPAGPTVELRVQALFGLADHPTVGVERIPLVLSLTSPAGRPIQTTRDLPGFWKGSWAAIAKEMRGRYPRHPWPDDPASASATLRTKRADARSDPSSR
ncbi:ATP-dependent helicase HrpB [Sphingobium nicotianae]|uniref:ATP-dependent helicase HrpB n=1 Tax=Sphingobium nicotianae TaxID=2782607 RepID=A0A9X1DG59_9SPHN|nr:ATP-dependent helicase HrpB [Sphingobium nicotianae]MBT2189352.1 ATP-dependent helicase HrpB [Sphingobium nicotianae]